ncbi:hypothetical protein WA1_49175 [Scytonema hofmannii PCC 7110]|uniref:Uncharacterized protein n=1 Tax=Scytonema hofmannii PCC 7110 TaxID=128403 RepID=A0A139WQL4_9CYAN|nr:hypothetical protein [Scytonema hofmannii]KYC34715.1 hypothetical protein WA1_49175 [Scytonema hofmannii PCC 7110]
MFDPRATQIASSYQNVFTETATKLGELAKVLVELALSKLEDKEEKLSKARVQIGSDDYVLSQDPECPGAWKWEKVDLTNNVNQTNDQAASTQLSDFQAQTLGTRLVLHKPETLNIDVVSNSEPAIKIVAYTDSGNEIDIYKQNADGICTKNIITENLSDEEIIDVAYEPMRKLLLPPSSILESSSEQNPETSKSVSDIQTEEELSSEEVAQIIRNMQNQLSGATERENPVIPDGENEEVIYPDDQTVPVKAEQFDMTDEDDEILESDKIEDIITELLTQVINNVETSENVAENSDSDPYSDFPMPPEDQEFIGFLEDIPIGDPPEEDFPPDIEENSQLILTDIEVEQHQSNPTLTTQAVLVREQTSETREETTIPSSQSVLVKAEIQNTQQKGEETESSKETINRNFQVIPTVEEIDNNQTNHKKSKPAGAYTYEQVAASENVSTETKRWAKQVEVPIYATSLWNLGERKRINAENVKIALAAKELLKSYGSIEPDGSRIYRSDAFVVKKDGENFTIHHRRDELNGFSNSLMQFKLDKKGNVKVQSPPKEMSPVERQEFLMVVEYLEESKKLPSLRDSDLRDVANKLGSLAPAGTFKTLESFRQTEVLEILNSALQRANTDQLTIGEFTIARTRELENNKANLILSKTSEEQGRQELVNFELQKTENGITKEVKKMNISDWDLTQLKFINQNAKAFDLDKFFQKDIIPPQPEPKAVPTELQRPREIQNVGEIPVKIHPYIAEEWKNMQNSKQYWSGAAKQGNEELNQKLQEGNGKLPISEQREMYFKIMMYKAAEADSKGEQFFDFAPLKEVMKDLEAWRKEEIINQFTPKTEISTQEKASVKTAPSRKEQMSL